MQIDIEAKSTIGEESFFEGEFSIRGRLRIDGRFVLEGHCTISHVRIENSPVYLQGLYNRT